MNRQKHKLSRRILAMLLTVAMLVTMFPATMFAEETESVTETVPVNDTSTYTITPEMSQEEVDEAVGNASGVITVQAGNYGIDGKKNHIKITLSKGNQTVCLEENGSYNRLMIVVLSENNILQGNGAKVDGDVDTVYNQSPMIYIPYGSLELQGSLSVVNHDYGVILGYTNATNESSTLKLSEGAGLNITNCSSVDGDGSYDNGIVCEGTKYFSYVDTQGDGTRGSSITTKGKGSNKTSVIVSSQATLNASDNSGAGIYSVNVEKFTLDLQPGSSTSFNENGQGICMNTDYSGSVNINVNASALNILGNKSNGVTGQNKPYILDIKNNGQVNVNENGGVGINNFYIKLDGETSKLSVSNNKSHGATNVAFDATNGATAQFNDNAYIGLNITKYNEGKSSTDIADSTVQANGNGGPGIRFYKFQGITNVKNSIIKANDNGMGTETYGYNVKPGDSGYWAGIVGRGTVNFVDSFVYSDSAGGYSLYNSHDDKDDEDPTNDAHDAASLILNGNDVVAFEGKADLANRDVFDDWNSERNTGRLYVLGGSLQAESQKITKGFEQSLNRQIPLVDRSGEKEDAQYGAPINNNRTALTRFDLNSEVDKGSSLLANNDNTFTFSVWDPNVGTAQNETEKAYDYTFRYNTADEDLTSEGGNAYVWTPVTMIHYDATEGSIADDALGTAQKGDQAIVSTRGDGSDLHNEPVKSADSYIDATDYTICGNSLALSEGILPTAVNEEKSFAGWYYAVGEEKINQAAKYAEKENYSDLYKLLLEQGKNFDGNTLTSADGNDVENITLYAVWTQDIIVSPANVTIYMGGNDGYEAVVGGNTATTATNSLPEPLFYINIPGVDKVDLEQLKFTNNDRNLSWTAEYAGDDAAVDGQPLYRLVSGPENEDPVRVQYLDGSSAVTSDEFEPTLEGDLYKEYEIKLYYGGNDPDDVKATYGDATYSVSADAAGKLIVRAVDNTENTPATNPVHGITNGTTGESVALVNNAPAAITAPADTTYTLNETTVPVDGAGVGLLFDGIINDDAHQRTGALIDKVDATMGGDSSNRKYQAQYLDLVDENNGNAWVKASNPVTITWAYPDGTNRYTEFKLYHFKGLHRDDSAGGQSGFDINDVANIVPEDVNINTDENGITFTVSFGGFSPFVLVWEEDDPYYPPYDPGDDDEKEPDTPALDRVNHFLYVEGYPEDYRTGEYSDNEDLWPVKPQGNITRAEVATIFYRLLKDEVREEIETDVNSFPDVNADDWFNVTVSSLANMNAISGYEDGTFRPNEPITRSELAAMAVRFYDTFEAEYEEGTFLDVDGDEWYADAIAAAEELGIIGGYPDGTVRPNNNITRAETCAIVNRVLERRPHDDHLGDVEDMRTWPDNQPGAWYYADMQEATNGHYYEWIDIDGSKFEEWTEVDKDYDWTKR